MSKQYRSGRLQFAIHSSKFTHRVIGVAVLYAVTFMIKGCTGNPEKAAAEKMYFDLQGFLDEQVTLLYKDSLIVLKTTEINGKIDQHEMPWTDWKKELSLFYASDINKASYSGKYNVDTTGTTTGTGQETILYKATDPSLRTRLMEISLEKDTKEVVMVHIENASDDLLTSSNEDLYYVPLQSYIIKSDRHMKLFGGNTIAVKGDIVSKERKYF